METIVFLSLSFFLSLHCRVCVGGVLKSESLQILDKSCTSELQTSLVSYLTSVVTKGKQSEI